MITRRRLLTALMLAPAVRALQSRKPRKPRWGDAPWGTRKWGA